MPVVFGLICIYLSQIVTAQQSQVQPPNPYFENFVKGAQFQDLILPRPITDGLESEGIWGSPEVLPRDVQNGIEGNQWSYWGGNPILCDDGNYHMAICRWPESKGHFGWQKSEVAHCFSKNPLGPYQITDTIIKEGHNPETIRLADGTFVVHTLNGNRIYAAKDMAGPWKHIGSMKLDPRGFRRHVLDEHSRKWLGSNLSTELRPDGNILMMTKEGGITYSTSGMKGPYRMIAISGYPRNTGYAEDPVLWKSRHQYHCVFNHALDRRSCHIRSLDAVHWKHEGGLAYGPDSFRFADGTQNRWYKFERPKMIQDSKGRATHMSLAVMDVSKSDDKGDDNHSSKHVVLPLAVEKLISISGSPTIDAQTSNLDVLIKAEPGFSPADDLDLKTLRIGSDRVVNIGKGAKAVDSSPQGDDLLIKFQGDFGYNRFDYDFKLLGSDRDGQLVFGYALLPGHSPEEATLIIEPCGIDKKGDQFLATAMVENAGLMKSARQDVVLLKYHPGGCEEVSRVSIEALEPYQNVVLSETLEEAPAKNEAYCFELVNPKPTTGYWKRVDNTDSSIKLTGDWEFHDGDNFFMGSESRCSALGDSCKFTFTGERARVYGSLVRKEMGAAEIYIDGKFVEKVALIYGFARSRIYQTPPLEPGTHTLELRSAPFQNRGPKMAIDYFEFESQENRIQDQ